MHQEQDQVGEQVGVGEQGVAENEMQVQVGFVGEQGIQEDEM